MSVPDTLHGRFRGVAAGLPERLAVSAGVDGLTYADLQRLADKITTVIDGVLAGDERLVAVRVRRRAWAPAALLGILGSGRGYVPVDPEYPASRQKYILDDSRVTIVITDSAIGDDEVPVATVGPFTVARRPAMAGGPAQVPDDTAYVIYTSGSTGAPKGCVVSHEHVLGLFDAADEIFDFGQDDVWTVFHSYSFDFSVWELWGALLHGGRAVTVPSEAANDPEALKTILVEEGVTVLNQVPSVFGFLVRELEMFPRPLPRLRHVIFGGEALNTEYVGRWTALGLAPGSRLTNMYGITETTVHVTHCEVTPESIAQAPAGSTPIGTALPHLTVSVRNEEGDPVPDGEPGEMWVSGGSVAHGYLNRQELTGARFVTAAHEGRTERFYRSGDHAVRSPDGSLYYIGRRDQQVKLRGFRIELGEVEAAIRSVPGVIDAACGVEENRLGHKVLVAYVVPDLTDCPPNPQIRAFLTDRLPRHMQPQRIKRLSGLPISAHGKLDRSALPLATSSTA